MKYENIEISDQSTNFLFVDRKALNSVFHGIDKVLLPGIPEASIAEIAVGAATATPLEFTQLLEALKRTDEEDVDLLAAVSDPNANLTVFAPLDQGFEVIVNQLFFIRGKNLPLCTFQT